MDTADRSILRRITVSEPELPLENPTSAAPIGLQAPPVETGGESGIVPSSDRLPRKISKLGAFGEMALCSGFPSQLVIGWVLRLARWSPLDANGQLSLGFVAALSLLDTVLLVGLMVWLLRSRGERPSAIWLGSKPIGA
jgi:hypothetical protein